VALSSSGGLKKVGKNLPAQKAKMCNKIVVCKISSSKSIALLYPGNNPFENGKERRLPF
jgi:hypothetical protein